MQRRMRMEDAQRVLFTRTVVAQNEIQAVLLPLFAQNRVMVLWGVPFVSAKIPHASSLYPQPRVQNPAGFGYVCSSVPLS